MKIKKITLRKFRNIQEENFYPDGNLNFLLGANGQGKTSFLEAIGYLATLRSFRGSKTDEVIQFGSEFAEIICELSPELSTIKSQVIHTSSPVDNHPVENMWITELKVVFHKPTQLSKRTAKVAFINGKPIKKSTQYLSQRFGSFELGFHAIVFNPSDHDLVRGDPSIRRGYLDRVLAAEDVDYLKELQKYQRVLDQRNSALKNSDFKQKDLLIGFTQQLSHYSAVLALKRLEWIQRLSRVLNDLRRQISPSSLDLRMVYLSSWVPPIDDLCLFNNNLGDVYFAGQGSLPSLEQLEQAFFKKFSSLEAAEWKAGYSLIGVHRDDWTFIQGSHILKGHGSQGEVRTALLALKLAEIRLFQEKTRHRPLFLLDDFSSELDQNRRMFLLKFLSESNLQVFVTTTDDSQVAGKQYWIANGSLKENKDDDRGSKQHPHNSS